MRHQAYVSIGESRATPRRPQAQFFNSLLKNLNHEEHEGH